LGLVLLGGSDLGGAFEVGGCERGCEGGCETGVPFGVSDAEIVCEPGKKTKHNIIGN
jgi:hypothetical protein